MKPRFEDSFLTRLIREFFILLVAVAVLELLIRLGTEIVDFYIEEPQAVRDKAEALASDVQTLMLNRGGPVAAKTMYPILDKTHDKVGYEIAIVPSEVTVTSIEQAFDFTPRGIPAEWPEGVYQSARVELRAEQFCINCHVDAQPGDVLGHVEVRKYLFEDLSHWWGEIQLTAIGGMGKIILHTIVLYGLLRVRMEPLNSLRDLVNRLAHAGSRVDERAAVRSSDEFGQLASDMNAFLDRVTEITTDAERVLEQIASLNVQLNEVRQRIEARSHTLRTHIDALETGAAATPGAWSALRDTIEALARHVPDDDPLAERLRATAAELEALAERGTSAAPDASATVGQLHADVGDLNDRIAEMAVLEERMQAIAAEGSRLLARLVDGRDEAGGDDEDHPPA